ncbi:MAG: hypothetical protein GC131_01625 [Alphaproteobacteria bacterium]|nr:hypothetical protein [Alphaproteobacteria bacterium]
MKRHYLFSLIEAYEQEGYTVHTSLNPYHCGGARDAPFTGFRKKKYYLRVGGGLSFAELHMFEILATVYEPKTILVIGNAFGWSALALSMIFPNAKLVAIDNLTEGDDVRTGMKLSQKFISRFKLKAQVVQAESPQDIPHVAEQYLDGAIDMVLVDGLHTETQQTADYNGVKPFLTKQGCIFFHDVINWHLADSFWSIFKDYTKHGYMLHRTPSGMGLVYHPNTHNTVGAVGRLFHQRW